MEAPSQSPRTPVLEEAPGPRQPKLRSTCDACQQAKVRCSHDTPHCRRCQIHKLDCVYSVSRRMGRPRRLQARDFEVKQQQQNKNPTTSSARTRASSDPSTVVVAAETTTTTIQPSSLVVTAGPDTTGQSLFHDALVDPLFGSGTIDHFDAGFNSPEDGADLGCRTSNSSDRFSIWSDSHLTFNGSLPLWEFASDSAASAVFSPTTLLSINTDTASHEATTGAALGSTGEDTILSSGSGGAEVLTSILDSQPTTTTNELAAPQKQQQQQEKPPLQTCTCYTTVLQELSRLHQDRTPPNIPPSPAPAASRIDTILQAEGSVQAHAAQVLACEDCAASDHRASLLLLLAMVIGHIVQMLGITCGGGNGSIGSHAGSSSKRRHPAAARKLPSSASPMLDNNAARFLGGGGGRAGRGGMGQTLAVLNCPLLVGEQEIAREDQVDLVKQLVQGRLSRLRSTLRRLRMEIEEHEHDSSSNAGAVMVSGLQKRLQSIIGRIELWDGE